VFYALRYFVQYADPSLAAGERRELRADVVTIIKTVDEYLIGAIILIFFADGHYEPFVRKLEATVRSERPPACSRYAASPSSRGRPPAGSGWCWL
jgi:uncharacterized membrane protein YqhA